MSIGTVYLIFAYTQALQQPLSSIARQVEDLQQAVASIRRITSLLGEQSAIANGVATPPEGALALDVDGVSFAYPGGQPVLRSVSLRLEPGQTLGLLGRTGSGKTTFTRLLFRLYDTQQGVLRINGIDLRGLNVETLRARIGLVTQDVQLFHASVRDNITFFDHTVPDARVHQVLDELGLDEWLTRLSDGIDTMVGPGGSRLSAGEAQLLAFARVYLKDPGLFILDEFSSRLDPATERMLDRAVARLLQGRTAIIIAHRLATLSRVERIAILEDGRLVEEGERVRLAADPTSRFARLLRVGQDEVLT